MTDKQTLLALAASCEAAAGADIQLDADIRDALNLPSDYSVEWRGWGYDEAGNPIEKPKAFPYTASLDAAMTLVPEGCDWLLDNFDGECGKPSAWVHKRGSAEEITSITGATPALALCAASLRARAGAMG